MTSIIIYRHGSLLFRISGFCYYRLDNEVVGVYRNEFHSYVRPSVRVKNYVLFIIILRLLENELHYWRFKVFNSSLVYLFQTGEDYSEFDYALSMAKKKSSASSLDDKIAKIRKEKRKLVCDKC